MRTLGAWSYVRAKMGPLVDEVTAGERWAVCMQCRQGDPRGNPLLRQVGDKLYCGQPRLQNVYRDEYQFGCGCDLSDKIWYANTGCPRGQW